MMRLSITKKDNNRKLDRMISTCVNNFDLEGKTSFVDIMTERESAELDVSKIEDDKFRFTGIYIKKVEAYQVKLYELASKEVHEDIVSDQERGHVMLKDGFNELEKDSLCAKYLRMVNCNFRSI